MNALLNSLLTHNELIQKLGLTCSKRKLAEARRGREPHYSEVVALIDQANLALVNDALNEANTLQMANDLIIRAKELLKLNVLKEDGTVNPLYMVRYKQYIDRKVQYNKLGKEPRNHKDLISLHQSVRKQHDELKNVSAVSA